MFSYTMLEELIFFKAFEQIVYVNKIKKYLKHGNLKSIRHLLILKIQWKHIG